MCGIAGIFQPDAPLTQAQFSLFKKGLRCLEKRGPDNEGIFREDKIILGHRRLSIIDTSSDSHQPFISKNERFILVFNGEIYNFKTIRAELQSKGYQFNTHGDTEVLLHAYIEYGTACLEKLNGFFAFAIYDKHKETLFMARDRMGIKPLLYAFDGKNIQFASEMKALIQMGINKDLDFHSLNHYFQLNYIPAPYSIFKSVKKLLPGHYAIMDKNGMTTRAYYHIPKDSIDISYSEAQIKIKELLYASVEKRMVSDVPLGTFLSGGIDSSIISTIAKEFNPHLETFSIGYHDAMFDESEYALAVAKNIGSKHHVFKLTNNDLLDALPKVLDYIDEPFADSSALAVYILSQKTKNHVTVALSGDGADEMFSGYNKHAAEMRIRKGSVLNPIIQMGAPLWKVLPHSRSSKTGNLFRQLDRFANGLSISPSARYWKWAGFLNQKQAAGLLKCPPLDFDERMTEMIDEDYIKKSFNGVLYNDMKLVLSSDMLTKVDLMSMAHGLEVRTPFLDHNLVNFVSRLPVHYKINPNIRKKILQETFREKLPETLFNRPKKGFEVPLLQWFKTDLKPMISASFDPNFIEEQGIFNLQGLTNIKNKLFSQNPGDSHATTWAVLVFQNWWKKYIM